MPLEPTDTSVTSTPTDTSATSTSTSTSSTTRQLIFNEENSPPSIRNRRIITTTSSTSTPTATLVTSTSTSTSSTTRQPTIRHGENNQQQYLPRGTNYADNTNILDIDPKHLGGILCAIAQSYSIIPGGLESLIRRVYTEYQIRLVEDPSSDNWKKFFLLPTILFDARREMNNKERKCSIKSAAEKLLSQDWSSFTLSFYTRRSNSHKETQEQESVHKRVSKQVRSGELSKGLKTLNSDRRIVPLNQDTFDQLKSKFPLPCDHNVPVDEVRQTMEFAVPRDEKFSFTE
jgi:hypothetical protein